jgi:hypothetical protein
VKIVQSIVVIVSKSSAPLVPLAGMIAATVVVATMAVATEAATEVAVVVVVAMVAVIVVVVGNTGFLMFQHC